MPQTKYVNENATKTRLYNKKSKNLLLSNRFYQNSEKINVPKINISDSDDNVIYSSEVDFNNNKNNNKAKLKEEEEDEDDDIMNPPKSRVDRFLSISVDDASILLGNYSSLQPIIGEEVEFSLETEPLPKINEVDSNFDFQSSSKKIEVITIEKNVTKQRVTKINDDDKIKSNKLRSYHDGLGIPQNVKADIIRSILKDYNTEYYVNKFTYRDIAIIKLDPHNIETRPVRERLMHLMKSDVIRINDVKYMRELSKKIQESYVKDQQNVMARLEEKERMRIRKLRLQGLIRDETDEDYFKSFNSRNYNPSKFLSQSYVRSFKN